MTNIDKLSDKVLESILENIPKEEIPHSSAQELMDAFLQWEGIIGYTTMIIEAWENIKSAQEPNALERLIQYSWDDEYTSYMEENDLTDDDDVISHALANKDQEHIFCALAELRVNHG